MGAAPPRGAGIGLSQADGPSVLPCPGRGCDRGIYKNLSARLAAIARRFGTDTANLEVWFGDQASIGQKNKITRRWARRGSRRSAPHDQRTASTYIFGAIFPREGKAAGLILPWCNIAAMQLFLVELSTRVATGRHAVLLLDKAGWHVSERLTVPSNITVMALPAECPELDPQENVWGFMRDNGLSTPVFTSHDNIVDHCADACGIR